MCVFTLVLLAICFTSRLAQKGLTSSPVLFFIDKNYFYFKKNILNTLCKYPIATIEVWFPSLPSTSTLGRGGSLEGGGGQGTSLGGGALGGGCFAFIKRRKNRRKNMCFRLDRKDLSSLSRLVFVCGLGWIEYVLVFSQLMCLSIKTD